MPEVKPDRENIRLYRKEHRKGGSTMKKRQKPSRKERNAHLTAAERREKRRERLVSLAFVSPSLLGVLIFFVLPFFVVIYYAFVNNPVLHEFVGFDNFRNLFQNQSSCMVLFPYQDTLLITEV